MTTKMSLSVKKLSKFRKAVLVMVVASFILANLAGPTVASSETEVSVKDFGAVGNGVSNDRQAYQHLTCGTFFSRFTIHLLFIPAKWKVWPKLRLNENLRLRQYRRCFLFSSPGFLSDQPE